PKPIIIGEGDYIEPNRYFKIGSFNREADNPKSLFDPKVNGLDFFECLEGMLVEIREGISVGGNDENNEIPVLSHYGKNATNRSIGGGLILAEDYSDFNPEVLTISDYIIKYKDYKTGDRFLAPIRGIVDYSYKRYKIFNTESLPEVESTLEKEHSAISKSENKLTICSYNIENFAPLNTPNGSIVKTEGIADDIVNRLFCPDIIGLVEVQDNSGNMDLGDASCDKTLNELIEAIEKNPSNTAKYKYRYINPIYGTEGGEPVGNIRVVFIYNQNRVTFVDKPTDIERNNDKELMKKLPEKSVELINKNGKLELSLNPGRIDPLNPDFSATRKSLAGEFIFKGEKVFIILNHLSAKGGDEALGGRFHPPIFKSEEKRVKQAKIINDFVQKMLNIEEKANIIVIGDYNDFHFSETLKTIKGNILTNLIEKLPVNDRYSYLYQGNSQILDNILVSKNILSKKPEIDIVHCNAEYSYNLNFTDHDPVISAFTFGDEVIDKVEPVFYKDYPKNNYKKCFELPLMVKLNKTGRIYYAGFISESYKPTNSEIKSGFYGDTTPIDIKGILNQLPPAKQVV
ncbi:MAG TPA: hypothetical protein PK771_13720, partial [Spirochaetota bacterium]|nr:hypothetical protein [Spirochaetota bacterium]